MKVRTGFVSNSSSSSYIIAFNEMDRSDLEVLFVSGSFSGSQTSLNAVGIKDIFNKLKQRYAIGSIESYWDPEDRDEENEYRWKQFVQFAGLASRIVRVVDGGEDVALVCISYGDDVSNAHLNSDSVRIIESFR